MALLYDPHKTFDDNYDHGPFDIDTKEYRETGEPRYRFF